MKRRSGAVALVLLAVMACPAAATPPGRNGMIVWQRESPTSFPRLWVANPDGSGARQVFTTRRNRGEIEGTFSPIDPNLMLFTQVSRAPFSENIVSGNLASGAVNP